MESWEDQGIVVGVRPHGESGAIVSLVTENHGRHAGYVRGARGSRMRGALELGNVLDVGWQSRVSDGLGAYNLELQKNYGAGILHDPGRLMALSSACTLCHEALPEREGHAGLFHGVLALFDNLQSDIWAPAYIIWELSFLRELGFSLDLTRCAGGGSSEDLAYVSPKTGRAVSSEKGAPYKKKLLKLPGFLNGSSKDMERQDIADGLKLTGYFLEHWAFSHHTQGVPDIRRQLYHKFWPDQNGHNEAA